MFRNIKKYTPGFLVGFYHLVIAYLAGFIYRFPSEKMIVIGITGTKGKSTTSYVLAQVLEKLGYKVGLSSGVVFKVGDKEWLNDLKMTMPGRFKLQKLLHKMQKAGCQIAVIETTSEGIKQYRHKGINYDIAIYTNLHPEHIESHGSFENYKKTKGQLFKHLTSKRIKPFFGKKIVIANIDDKESGYFLSFPADEKIGYGVDLKYKIQNIGLETVKAENMNIADRGIDFEVDGVRFSFPFLGMMNVYNMLAVLSCCFIFKDKKEVAECTENIKQVPGRVEFIDAGQSFDIVVDYAHDPYSLENLFQTLKQSKLLDGGKVIHIFGATGGGRDRSKRPYMGKVSDRYADIIVLTNDDPYDDNEEEIIDDIYKGIENKDKVIKIVDRRKAIEKGISLAQKGDIVLITGKGAEQKIMLPGGAKDWDDRKVVTEILHNRVNDGEV